MTKEQYKSSGTKKGKKKKKSTVIVLISLFLILVTVLLILSLTVFFKIENFDISGSKTYTEAQIIEVSGLETGDNLIRISPDEISENICSELPFIKSVEIKRSFPSTVKITVKETKEEIIISNGKKRYSADLSGKILKEYVGDVSDELILFTVSKDVTLKNGENITFASEREEELFKCYTELINSDLFKVNFVNISDPFDSYVKIEDRMIVLFGSSTHFEEKKSYLVSGYPKISSDLVGIFDLSSWTPESNSTRFRPQSISSYEN